MPADHRSNKYLKLLTITMSVTLVIALISFAVIRKARRDAEQYTGESHFKLAGIQFDSREFVILKWKAVPNSASTIFETIDWSLTQRGVSGVNYSDWLEQIRKEMELNEAYKQLQLEAELSALELYDDGQLNRLFFSGSESEPVVRER